MSCKQIAHFQIAMALSLLGLIGTTALAGFVFMMVQWAMEWIKISHIPSSLALPLGKRGSSDPKSRSPLSLNF